MRLITAYSRKGQRNVKAAMPYVVILALAGVIGYRTSVSIFAAPIVSGGLVRLSVDQPQYSLGQTVRFTLTNDSPKPISVINNCPNEPLEVYRQQAKTGQWQRIRDTADAAKCANAPRQYVIAAGAASAASYRYWPDLFAAPGRYRIIAPIEQYDDRPAIEFDVVAQ